MSSPVLPTTIAQITPIAVCRRLRVHVNEGRTVVEKLDATDPVVTARMSRIVRRGWFGIRTVPFWYFCAEWALVSAVVLVVAADLPWSLVLAFGLISGVLVHVMILWLKLHFRAGILSGDQWYVLDTEAGQAVALVKSRRGNTFVVVAAADSMSLFTTLRRALDQQSASDRRSPYFVVASFES
ncbi:MAG: hypothetical protein WA962_13505 [Ornithinimicrobium sp.]